MEFERFLNSLKHAFGKGNDTIKIYLNIIVLFFIYTRGFEYSDIKTTKQTGWQILHSVGKENITDNTGSK